MGISRIRSTSTKPRSKKKKKKNAGYASTTCTCPCMEASHVVVQLNLSFERQNTLSPFFIHRILQWVPASTPATGLTSWAGSDSVPAQKWHLVPALTGYSLYGWFPVMLYPPDPGEARDLPRAALSLFPFLRLLKNSSANYS